MASSANSVPCQGGQCRDSEVCPKARRQRWLEETERGREVELVRLQGSGSQPGGGGRASSRLSENLASTLRTYRRHDVTSFWQYSWGCWDWSSL